MSNSVSISIATNSAIAAAKGFGWFVTGSPTLFAETIHSLADVGNQVLLKVGEVRGRAGPTEQHPFGRSQDKFFWALVSAVSVFFVGCGINIYHGVVSLLHPEAVQPFSLLIIGLLVFALALETWTLTVALKELGGFAGVRENLNNTTVVAVLLEDGVALFGILLTLLVAGVSYLAGPKPGFDAIVAIAVGVILGAMAVFLAMLNRRLLIDVADPQVDKAAGAWLAANSIEGRATSLLRDDDRAVVFIEAAHEVPGSYALGETLKRDLEKTLGTAIDAVYWKFKTA